MEFKDIVMKRYSAKKFDGRKIPDEKFDELMEMIRFSASSYNLQPWKIKVVTDQETKDKLMPASWNQPQVSTCSHLLVFCADTNVSGLIDLLEEKMLERGTPEAKVKAYANIMRNSPKLNDDKEKVHWAKRQLYIALGNAMNGAKSLGFDSCPMEGFQPEEYSKILGIDDSLIPTIVLPIGFPADEPRPKLRFSREEITF